MERLHFTKPGQPLARELSDRIAAAQSTDPTQRVTVVAPSYIAAHTLRYSVTQTLNRGLFNVEFVTLVKLLNELFKLTDAERKPRLSGLISRELAREAALQVQSSDDWHKFVSEHSFVNRLVGTFNELDPIPSETVNAKLLGKLKPVAKALKHYRASRSKFNINQDIVHTLLPQIEQGENNPLQHFGRIILIVTEIPQPFQVEFVTRLANYKQTETIIATGGDERTDKTLAELFKFEFPPTSSITVNRPRFITTRNYSEEVTEVARRVKQLAKDKSIKPHRVAILCPDGSYVERVTAELEHHHQIPVAKPGINGDAFRAEIRFLETYSNLNSELNFKSIKEWLLSAPLKDPNDNKPIPANLWVSILNEINTGRPERWETNLTRYLNQLKHKLDKEDTTSQRKVLVNRINEVERFLKFLPKLKLDLEQTRMPNSPRSTIATNLNNLLKLYLATLNETPVPYSQTVLLQLGELEDLLGSGVSSRHFIQSAVLELKRRGQFITPNDGVLVTQLSDCVGAVFDAVFILGMEEGIYPNFGQPNSFLDDTLRDKIEPRQHILPRFELRQARQRNLLRTFVNSAANVYLIWPRRSGLDQTFPAVWFVELMRETIDPNINVEQLVNLDEKSPLEIPNFALDLNRADTLRRNMDSSASPAEYTLFNLAITRALSQNQLGNHYASRPPQVKLALDTLRAHRTWTDWNHYEGNLAGNFQLKTPLGTSAAAITKFINCPYHYFLDYELGINSQEEDSETDRIKPKDLGILVHQILNELMRQSYDPQDTPQSYKERIIKILERNERKYNVGYRALWRIYKQKIIEQYETWFNTHKQTHEAGWRTKWAEQKFGFASKPVTEPTERAAALKLLDGKVELRGSVDRLDIHKDDPTRVLVVDYKTGSSTRKQTLLQLGVYSLAARALLQADDITAGYWFVMEAPLDGTVKRDEKPISDELDTTVKIIKGVYKAIHAGLFIPNCAVCVNKRTTLGFNPARQEFLKQDQLTRNPSLKQVLEAIDSKVGRW